MTYLNTDNDSLNHKDDSDGKMYNDYFYYNDLFNAAKKANTDTCQKTGLSIMELRNEAVLRRDSLVMSCYRIDILY